MAQRPSIAIIGAGGMGLAVAHRLGSGHRIILADFAQKTLDKAAQSLRDAGHLVDTHLVDVVDFASVTNLAKFASSAGGELKTVVNTAGLSPSMAPAKRVYEVDLLGTLHVLDAFIPVMNAGSSLVTIASIAGHMTRPAIPPEMEKHLATATRDNVLTHAGIDLSGSSAAAYGVSKWGTILQVRAAARAAGERGVRVNTISPGVIYTPMVAMELESEGGQSIRQSIENSPAKRAGTADDVAGVVAFLAGPDASFITGSDIVVDGGSMALGGDFGFLATVGK